MAKSRSISQKSTYPEGKMAKISRKNNRTNTKKVARCCTASKLTTKKTSVNRGKASDVICSHRTPTQLHASTYVYNKPSQVTGQLYQLFRAEGVECRLVARCRFNLLADCSGMNPFGKLTRHKIKNQICVQRIAFSVQTVRCTLHTKYWEGCVLCLSVLIA